MALKLRAKRPFISTRLTGTFVAIAALLLQPFGALPIASAASIALSPTSHTIDGASGGSRAESSTSAAGYHGLSLSFNFDINKLEPSKTLTYGWRTSAGTDQELGSVEGETNTGGNPGPNEIGQRTVSLPNAAAVSDLKLVFKHNGSANGANDRVEITNITLNGSQVEQNTVCDSNCEWTTVVDAVNGEAAGSTITIKADSPKTVTSTILVNKPLTITGQAGAKIQTSGSNLVFTTTGNNVIISNLAFEKTDTAFQELINVQGDDTTVSGNTFSGQYTPANNTTSRALVVSGGANGLTIDGNGITGMRQPAYINNGATGTITNNFVSGSRGWVVEKASDFSFSGNTWSDNFLDIAIIPGVNPESTVNNYSCRIAQIKSDNSNAKVEDQYPAYCPVVPGPTANYTVNGSTTAAENEAGKWWFNRDANTATAYNFTAAQKTTGVGSLFVPAIGTNPSDKFIAEYFVANKLDDTGSISFDYRLGDGVAASKANHVYMNVYVNYSSTTNYGDCVYSVSATDGSTGWHALPFAPNGIYDVRTRSSAAPNVCPSKPSDLPATAYVRAIALNLGDTSSNDAGVSAYFDNVRVEKVVQTAVYDFEPDTTKPTVSLIAPAAGALNPSEIVVDASDDQALNRVTANVRNASNAIVASCSPSANGAKTYRLTCGVPNTLADGQYTVRYNASDASGNVSATSTVIFSVDRTAPDVAIAAPAQGSAVRGAVTVKGEISDANRMTSYLRITGPNGYVVASYFADGRAAHEYAWNTTGLTDGLYTIRFEARDAAGNKDAGSVRDIQVTVDNTKGTTILNAPAEGTVFKADFTVEATSTDVGSGIARGVANLYRADGTLLKTCYNQVVSPAQSSRDFSCDVDVDTLQDGAYYLRVNASDRAGNVTNTVTRTFTVDKTAPGAPALSVNTASGEALTTGRSTNSYGIVANWNQPSSDTVKYVYKYWNAIPGNPYKESSPYTVEVNGTSQSGVFNQGEGTHYLQIVAVDAVGNQSAGSNVFEIRYDTTAPAVEAGDDQDVEGLSATLSPETDAVEQMAWEQVSGPGTATFTPVPNGSDVRVDVDEEGEYVFRLTARDSAGNESEDTVTVTFNEADDTTPVDNGGTDTGTGTNGGSSNGTSANPLTVNPLTNVASANAPSFAAAFIGSANQGTPSETAEDSDTGDVLGTTVTESDDEGEVAGANDQAGWSIEDMAWYWWVLAVLGIMGLWLLLAAAIRRFRGSEA